MTNLKRTLIGLSIFLTTISLHFAQNSLQKIQPPSVSVEDTKGYDSEIARVPKMSVRVAPTSSNSPSITSPLIEKESWTVSIKTLGGFPGQDVKSLVVKSNGNVNVNKNEESLTREVPLNDLKTLSQKVMVAAPTDFAGQVLSLCSDCSVTTLNLYRYKLDGTVEKYAFSWDIITYSKLSEDIRQIYEEVIKITKIE